VAYVARIAASEVTSVAMLGKVSTIVIVTSSIVLSVAADRLIRTGIRQDVSAARADIFAVRYNPERQG
jgi:hypothetical protein